LKTGVCAGKDMLGSEETTIAGELWPSVIVMMEVVEEADELFCIGLRWTSNGTSSVSRCCRSLPPVEPADEDEEKFCSSNEVRLAGNVLVCGLRGVVNGGNGDGECGDCGD
jgi:hypothetical protein